MSRTPLKRWTRPKKDDLEETYPSGQPPFYPFPTVSNVVNAAFCPVAIYHDFLHGTYQDVTSSPTWKMQGVENLFHQYIAHLKSTKAKGELDLTGIDRVRQDFFYSFSRNYKPERSRDSCWNYYLEPWIYRKFKELVEIRKEAFHLFEITVSNAYVDFVHRGKLTYPLLGVCDEIDIDNKRIIERTIKGMYNDDHPPSMKDYQLWLIWKIISSIPRSEYPKEVKNIDFSEFNLVVETPYKDFNIEKENPKFEELTHHAYAWIHDVAFERKSGYDVFQHKHCTRTNKIECGLQGFCFRRKPRFPESRPEMRRAFKDIYRPLFWDQMWNWHLFKYQLVMLPYSKLETLGLLSKGKKVNASKGKIEIEVPELQANQLQAHSEMSFRRYTIVPFGNFFFGKRLEATLGERVGNRLVMEVPKKEFRMSETILILPKSDVTIIESPPWYLSRNLQSSMFSLESIGTKDPEKAGKDSIVQFLESLFGQKPLRREGIESDH